MHLVVDDLPGGEQGDPVVGERPPRIPVDVETPVDSVEHHHVAIGPERWTETAESGIDGIGTADGLAGVGVRRLVAGLVEPHRSGGLDEPLGEHPVAAEESLSSEETTISHDPDGEGWPPATPETVGAPVSTCGECAKGRSSAMIAAGR